MPVLDPRTIDRVAELICDYGGPYQRRVREVRQLLEGAGWDIGEPDGSLVPWLVATIRDRNDDQDAIEALLRRIVDPREYRGGLTDAQAFVTPLNTLLDADGLAVGHRGAQPFVRRTSSPDEVDLDVLAARLADPQLRESVRRLVTSEEMADILVTRLDEVEMCRNAGAHLLAVIGTGSFIEGLLYDALRSRDPVVRKATNPTLNLLLDRAHSRGWIQHDAFSFSGLVRDYRNLVHPREQLQKKFTPDNDTVLLCWQPVLAVINDLMTMLPMREPRSASPLD